MFDGWNCSRLRLETPRIPKYAGGVFPEAEGEREREREAETQPLTAGMITELDRLSVRVHTTKLLCL